ncbi:MAG: rRNA pseudouridine synthase [Chloroflexota bacterium]|nr:rRNA pseudouridine synthase [Chloroflexota bacterium]
MRVQRALALAGVASRRAAEKMVEAGRVTINGRLATIGQDVADGDDLAVDGRRVAAEETRTYLLNKRVGTVSTVTDPQGRPTVREGMPSDVRLYPVGRLDLNSSGVLLITNDGELSHRLTHPRFEVPKVYDALVEGRVSAETIRLLRNGVELDDGMTHPAKVEKMERLHPGGTWLRIQITEGRNRQVRRMCEAVGHPTTRLYRSRYAGLGAGRLRPGEWRPLTVEELRRLGRLVELER